MPSNSRRAMLSAVTPGPQGESPLDSQQRKSARKSHYYRSLCGAGSDQILAENLWTDETQFLVERWLQKRPSWCKSDPQVDLNGKIKFDYLGRDWHKTDDPAFLGHFPKKRKRGRKSRQKHNKRKVKKRQNRVATS